MPVRPSSSSQPHALDQADSPAPHAAFILLLALVSELPLPFPPLSRPAVLLERFWIAFFPPFGNEYGVGVLGAVQVFVGAQVLSH